MVVFLVHPQVSRVLFASFNCVALQEPGPSYLREELSEQCWVSRHLGFALGFGVSGMALWVVGLPLWTFLVLRDKRALLANTSVRLQYGFLYNGYAPRSYYWEVVSLVRKELVAGVAVFLAQQGTLAQSFVLLLLLFLALLLTLRVRPFVRPLLNSLESFSLSALIISVFAGLFFLGARDPSSQHFQPGKDCKPSPHL